MFSGLRKGLKVIDFYQAVPNQYSEGTISGACISILSITLLILLSLYSLFRFISPTIVSDLIIDQKHLSEKLQVNIDISFHRYPCSFLSLDIQNVLKLHLVNIEDNLQKFVLPGQSEIYSDKGMTQQQKLQRVVNDIKAEKGCRMKGFFQIDRVPGNFHFSCHGYGSIIPSLINQGNFDMSHTIHSLTFGKYQNYGVLGRDSLGGFRSEKQINEAFMGISYTYFLDIIEHNSIILDNQQATESYRYTARLNQVILAQLPMVFFKYETNPMTVLQIYYYEHIHDFLIEFVGILGGIFTVSAIIDNLIHSSIRFLLKKHQMGKLV